MAIKKDIESRDDIKILVENFYENVKKDDVIGKLFTEVFPLNWETHIPLIIDFWETVLLDSMKYKGNVMEKHLIMNEKHPFTPEHFERWLQLFYFETDRLFSGPVSELAKKRATGIAGLMNFKMNSNNKTGLL